MKLACRLAALAGAAALLQGMARAAAPATPQKAWLGFPLVAPPAELTNKPTECGISYGPVAPISALSFSADGTMLAVGGYGEVLLWDLERPRLARRFGQGQISNRVRALAFDRSGRRLAVGEGSPGRSGLVRVFDALSGSQTTFFQDHKDIVLTLAFSPNGALLAAAGTDPAAHVWGLPDGKRVASLQEQGQWAHGLSFSRSGRLLATGATDGSVHVWDTESWKRVARLTFPDAVLGLAFNPEDEQFLAVAVGGPMDRSVQLRRIERPAPNTPGKAGGGPGPGQQGRTLDTGPSLPLGLAWDPLGDRLYAPGSDKAVRAFNANNGALMATMRGHADWVNVAAVSPRGDRIASGSSDGTVRVWSGATHRLLAVLIQIATRSDHWLILTPPGYFTSSSATLPVQWRKAGGESVSVPLERLNNPGAVAEILAGKLAAPPPAAAPKSAAPGAVPAPARPK